MRETPTLTGTKRICFVTTSPLMVNFFLAPLLKALATRYEVALAVNDREGVALPSDLPGRVYSVQIVRHISPVLDFVALWKLYRLFRASHFDAVHSVSPKGGLLAMTAAHFARVPLRVHTFTGQVWVTRTGLMRWLLKQVDRWIAALASCVLADSESQRQFLAEQRVIAAARCQVLGSGSISGVDCARFHPDSVVRAAVRSELHVNESTVLLAFVGRIGRDKGVLDLASAFGALYRNKLQVALIFVGPDEESLRGQLELVAGDAAACMRFVPYTTTPERYLAAADVLCVPSYREGFGSVIIEAGATGIPAVGSRIYGVIDAIVDGDTGFLHEPRNVADIVAKLVPVVRDSAMRERLGARARERALRDFSQKTVTDALLRFYQRELGCGGIIQSRL